MKIRVINSDFNLDPEYLNDHKMCIMVPRQGPADIWSSPEFSLDPEYLKKNKLFLSSIAESGTTYLTFSEKMHKASMEQTMNYIWGTHDDLNYDSWKFRITLLNTTDLKIVFVSEKGKQGLTPRVYELMGRLEKDLKELTNNFEVEIYEEKSIVSSVNGNIVDPSLYQNPEHSYAIVNAANPMINRNGSGVNRAISRLLNHGEIRKWNQLALEKGYCHEGDACLGPKISKLNNARVIHAVGPDLRDHDTYKLRKTRSLVVDWGTKSLDSLSTEEQLLYKNQLKEALIADGVYEKIKSAYQKAFEIGHDKKITHFCVPYLSSGEYRGDLITYCGDPVRNLHLFKLIVEDACNDAVIASGDKAPAEVKMIWFDR